MPDKQTVAPDNTAVRVALWRALHVEVDAPPHILEDVVGMRLAAPEAGWRERPDMHPMGTRLFHASIVARARFIEDLIVEQSGQGVSQYVILGAGLDTFAQRRPEVASRLKVFEIDQPGPQQWKQNRLNELGYGAPAWLRFVPVDFEAGGDWWRELIKAGFDVRRPGVVVSTGVSMYLTLDAIMAKLRQVATLVAGSTFVMSFLMPFEYLEPDMRPGMEMAAKGARAAGTPFISFFTPEQVLALAHEAGFRDARHVSSTMLGDRYFSARADGLRPIANSEELLVART